jgi:hypothetical protein
MPRKVLIVYRLQGDTRILIRAGKVLSDLGFANSARGVRFPPGVRAGLWTVEDADIADIRNTVIHGLSETGVVVKALLVADFNEAAWQGPVPNKTQTPDEDE